MPLGMGEQPHGPRQRADRVIRLRRDCGIDAIYILPTHALSNGFFFGFFRLCSACFFRR